MARGVAYYKAEMGMGVLGPRGWHCFGTYGSGGAQLFISPEQIEGANLFAADRKRFDGPVIEISYFYGGTSGRDAVAQVIARVFPEFKAFVADVVEMFDRPASYFPFGPYPKDTVIYKNKTVVEYRTPAQTEGLGTGSWLQKNDSPINGVAILTGQTPDLVLLAVRLPAGLGGLTSAIVDQVERDAARRPGN